MMNTTRQIIRVRTEVFTAIRAFFASRDVLEVDTPMLSPAAITDPHLHSLRLEKEGDFLHTSPEFEMKKQLAAGSGDIFQLCHVFRGEEEGRKHRREFMLLEWYRCGFNHQDLMTEVADLVKEILPEYQEKPLKISPYSELFKTFLGLDLACTDLELIQFTEDKMPDSQGWTLSRDGYLDLLFTHFIEPHLGQEGLEFVCDYPPSQAALAKIITDDNGNSVAARFELYIKGVELCNGFWELADSSEQKARFMAENAQRCKLGLAEMPIDHGLIAALGSDHFPECAGVALGVDRLLMLRQKSNDIAEVTINASFPCI